MSAPSLSAAAGLTSTTQADADEVEEFVVPFLASPSPAPGAEEKTVSTEKISKAEPGAVFGFFGRGTGGKKGFLSFSFSPFQ